MGERERDRSPLRSHCARALLRRRAKSNTHKRARVFVRPLRTTTTDDFELEKLGIGNFSSKKDSPLGWYGPQSFFVVVVTKSQLQNVFLFVSCFTILLVTGNFGFRTEETPKRRVLSEFVPPQNKSDGRR